jgi:hypothetical protein
LGRLCYDPLRGRISEDCQRDGAKEKYLNPLSLRIRVKAALPAGFGSARCHWTFGSTPAVEHDCTEAVSERVSTRKPTRITVSASNSSGGAATGMIDVQPRDLLIVGLGDSIASGEGNPVRPVALSSNGFCFRRVLSPGAFEDFHLPGRDNAAVEADCPLPTNIPEGERERWDRAAASWLYNQCHRSLYSYQTRLALTLAVENRQLAITYLPLGCSGATIKTGLIGSQPARERPLIGKAPAPPDVEAQFSQLANYLGMSGSTKPIRPIDVILLTIGANDVGFSGLVANIIVGANRERGILKDVIVTPDQARNEMQTTLRADFRKLRTQLRRFIGGDLRKVLFTTYGNPVLHETGTACPASRRGFDAHPAFAIDAARLQATVSFVENEFFPRLQAHATCTSGGNCANPALDRMTFVDGHRSNFADHGFCANASSDPAFDRDCFRDGDSFKDLQTPLTCPRQPSEFRSYASRMRWIRTVNDSYFAAMTYPAKPTKKIPADIHDARWGLEAVTYGGAIHPTAEGHAAMADAALVRARHLLGLPAPEALVSSNP